MHRLLASGLLALGCAVAVLPSRAAPPPPETVLADPGAAAPAAAVRTTDATVEVIRTPGHPVFRVATRPAPGWPGVAFPAPAGAWDLAAHAGIETRVRNAGMNDLTVFARVDNPGADGTRHCVTENLRLGPGESGTLRVELKRFRGDTLGGRLIGLRGYPVRRGGEGTLDPARITQVLVFVHQPAAAHVFELGPVTATGREVVPTASTGDADPYFPLIDRFGQYRHRAWPGKVASLEDLHARRVSEDQRLSDDPGPSGWSRFGGWSEGPRRSATGFFRVEKVDGRWWFVDPEGWLFWSHGVDCVRMLDTTPVEGRETWFESFPGAEPGWGGAFAGAQFALKGHYAGRSPACFSFAGANLLRKYGPDWKAVSAERAHRRLRAWGLNTIGNWSDREVTRLRRTVYTDSVHADRVRQIEGSEGYWGKFPDVFDPAFAEGLRRQVAAKQGGAAGDPWCLGFFSDNEMAWGDEFSLAEAALRSPPDQPAKRAFLDDLRHRYASIGALNEAWGTAHASWDALLAHRTSPDRGRAGRDLQAFYTRLAEAYFRSVRDALRAGAPGQLYLGCRFAWANPLAAAAAARYCDVVSYNLYRRTIAQFRFDGGADVPLLVGEFHFGALDRGLFHTGLVPVADQAARAEAYREYVEGALRHPQFVGTHWFQWQDEPTTGRAYDEENYQIGLVDIADSPYPETVDALRAVGDRMYRLRKEAP